MYGRVGVKCPESAHSRACNIVCQVQVKEKGGATKDKVLLNNISAKANHGEVLAIAGPSGSSKSTLLDALAGRIDRRSLRGSILVNGMPIDQTFRRVSGYVMQDDALYPVLTVRETLMFSARLRLPSTWTDDQRMARVEIILAELGLQPCADLVIGDDLVCSNEKSSQSSSCFAGPWRFFPLNWRFREEATEEPVCLKTAITVE